MMHTKAGSPSEKNFSPILGSVTKSQKCNLNAGNTTYKVEADENSHFTLESQSHEEIYEGAKIDIF